MNLEVTDDLGIDGLPVDGLPMAFSAVNIIHAKWRGIASITLS